MRNTGGGHGDNLPPAGMLPNDLQRFRQTVGFHADHQGGVAAAQKSAGAGNARYADIAFDQRIGQGLLIVVLYDGKQQFQNFSLRSAY